MMPIIALGSLRGGLLFGSAAFFVIVPLYGLVSALVVYVTFGWLEQTLTLLIGIALNTAEGADLMDLDAERAGPVIWLRPDTQAQALD